MNDRIHILITGEHGKTFKLHFKRQKLCIVAMLATITFVTLSVVSYCSISLFSHNQDVSGKIATLRSKTQNDEKLIANLLAESEASAQKYEQELAAIKEQHEQAVKALIEESDKKLAAHQMKAADERNMLKAQIAKLSNKNEELFSHFEQEKDELLSTAVNDLYERSELIETMMRNIGVKVSSSSSKSNGNSGGPFIALEPGTRGDLLKQTDQYIKAIKAIPLGRPINTRITSRFGPRKDPLNKKRAFHEGIDFAGKRGDKIYATADGIVKTAKRHRSYGNYVEIDHKNGYLTSFAHMNKYLVKVGDKVKRGQLIGHLGNTGRSTGPHLHYEVLYKGKPTDPMKFMQVTKLVEKKITLSETNKKKYGNVQ